MLNCVFTDGVLCTLISDDCILIPHIFYQDILEREKISCNINNNKKIILYFQSKKRKILIKQSPQMKKNLQEEKVLLLKIIKKRK